MRMILIAAALVMMVIPGAMLADTNYDDSEAIMAELTGLSKDCASLEPGSSRTEIFGIQIIRVENTCAIVMGQEIDERVRIFLEEQNLPWAGVGLWVNVSPSSD